MIPARTKCCYHSFYSYCSIVLVELLLRAARDDTDPDFDKLEDDDIKRCSTKTMGFGTATNFMGNMDKRLGTDSGHSSFKRDMQMTTSVDT